MANLWHGLEMRLKAVANNCQAPKKDISYSGKKKHEFGGQGVAIITLRLIRDDLGQLCGWQKPERTPLEPRGLDPNTLPIGRWCSDWERVISVLQEGGYSFKLVVKDGQPVGWLEVVGVTTHW